MQTVLKYSDDGIENIGDDERDKEGRKQTQKGSDERTCPQQQADNGANNQQAKQPQKVSPQLDIQDLFLGRKIVIVVVHEYRPKQVIYSKITTRLNSSFAVLRGSVAGCRSRFVKNGYAIVFACILARQGV